MESRITYDSKAVSTELYEEFNLYIKTAAEGNNFKNQTPSQTLKQSAWSALSRKPSNSDYNASTQQATLPNWDYWDNAVEVNAVFCVIKDSNNKSAL